MKEGKLSHEVDFNRLIFYHHMNFYINKGAKKPFKCISIKEQMDLNKTTAH